MKKNALRFKNQAIVFTFFLVMSSLQSCFNVKPAVDADEYLLLSTNLGLTGPLLEVQFERGNSHNHPLMAVWAEDTLGNYLQTLYVAKSIAKGVFQHGDASSGKWLPGPIRRPAALPVWSHSHGVKAEDGLYLPTQDKPLPDAITGPTPQGNFILSTRLTSYNPSIVRVFFEINQTWDFNEYWTNNKYPDDKEYKTSCQPSLIYATTIDLINPLPQYKFDLIGHGHYSGADGAIYTDLSTFTTALEITKDLKLRIR